MLWLSILPSLEPQTNRPAYGKIAVDPGEQNRPDQRHRRPGPLPLPKEPLAHSAVYALSILFEFAAAALSLLGAAQMIRHINSDASNIPRLEWAGGGLPIRSLHRAGANLRGAK
ncbi:MAG TPA: hypothetical protein VGP12_02765 [Nitrosospira sp.]|nr:hypothetical protein [Nitrosospira sp.]